MEGPSPSVQIDDNDCGCVPAGGLLTRHRFIDRGTARRALFDYIEGWYYPHRRYSGFRVPVAGGIREEMAGTERGGLRTLTWYAAVDQIPQSCGAVCCW